MHEQPPRQDRRDEPAMVSAEALDRERLLTYVEWGEVEVPWWYWPTYAAVIAVWIAAYGRGLLWGAVGAVLMAATMGALFAVATSRSGVSTPRFRGMPRSLQRTFLPIVAAAIASILAVGSTVLLVDDPPFLVLGLVIGPALAVSGIVHTRWYRREARQVAADNDLVR